jgi:hypothetical protein
MPRRAAPEIAADADARVAAALAALAEVRDADRLMAVAFAALDGLAETGNQTARHCAHALRGARSIGRPLIDDVEALGQVERLVADGRGRAAASIVARSMTDDPHEAAIIAKRLRRKIKVPKKYLGISESEKMNP